MFEPISIKDMTHTERQRAQESFTFIEDKRDGSVKGRLVFNDNQQEIGFQRKKLQVQQQ